MVERTRAAWLLSASGQPILRRRGPLSSTISCAKSRLRPLYSVGWFRRWSRSRLCYGTDAVVVSAAAASAHSEAARMESRSPTTAPLPTSQKVFTHLPVATSISPSIPSRIIAFAQPHLDSDSLRGRGDWVRRGDDTTAMPSDAPGKLCTAERKVSI